MLAPRVGGDRLRRLCGILSSAHFGREPASAERQMMVPENA